MAENVKVIVRCRPINQREIDLNCKCVVKVENCTIEIWDPNDDSSFPKQFTFDSTYGQDSTTEAIYNDICYPLIESVLEGYNATIFVYGQTGCGKSFSMEGLKVENSPQKGIIPRAFEHIFEAIAVTTGVKYLALVSYLEIYNEQIRDLLLPTECSTSSPLTLKESPNEGVTVPGLTSHPVHNAAECEHFLNIGSKNRIIGATLMNQNSSRSHSIFTINIEQISDTNNNENIRKGKLNLVDLAGSERQTKTGATGDRLKEATKINLSLSALGNVISALVDGKSKHIPYRDSKLTRLLQDSLGGNTRTLMIACISPSSRDYMETLSTLRYANRAKNIHNKPKVNEDPKDAILREYQKEIDRLRNLLECKSNDKDIESFTLEDNRAELNRNIPSQNIELDAKRDKLIQEYQEEMGRLKNLHENEKNEKEIVMKQIATIKAEYEKNIHQLNQDFITKKHKNDSNNEEEILRRIETLKAAMIGGEKADDKELSEKRKRKKMAAERRASVIAHLLAKIDMSEDRELLHDQYKNITQELNLKTDALRRFRHKVKALQKEVTDIQGEFETEREDYLETIRKQNKQIKLLSQICEKIAGTLKKGCNYRDLEAIKEKAIWLEESQKYKLPEFLIPRTKLPPAEIQTAPARLQFDEESSTEEIFNDRESPVEKNSCNTESIIENYFQPTTRRARQLLGQSAKLDAATIINTWRDYAKRNKSSDGYQQDRLKGSPFVVHQDLSELNSSSLNASPASTESFLRKPLRLEALPNMETVRNRRQRLHTFELL